MEPQSRIVPAHRAGASRIEALRLRAQAQGQATLSGCRWIHGARSGNKRSWGVAESVGISSGGYQSPGRSLGGSGTRLSRQSAPREVMAKAVIARSGMDIIRNHIDHIERKMAALRKFNGRPSNPCTARPNKLCTCVDA